MPFSAIMLRAPLTAIGLAVLPCAAAAAAEAPSFPFTLSRPAGTGPFPAVVILHDCSGLGPRSSGMAWRWSSELTRLGYVTIWPDSFAQRGRPKGVCTDPSLPRVTYAQRARDAYAALAYLASLPFVDAKRIAVMGGSHGGTSTLATVADIPEGTGPESAGRAEGRFAAAVALYPSCGLSVGSWSVERSKEPGRAITAYRGAFKPLAPVLILIGELDDWTPASRAVGWQRPRNRQGIRWKSRSIPEPITPSTASCRPGTWRGASTGILQRAAAPPPGATRTPGPMPSCAWSVFWRSISASRDP